MTMGFHFEDRPPQLWLDELTKFGIPRLWDIKLTETQRANLLARAKQQLKDWRIALREQIKTIETRYNKEKEGEKRLMIAPYQKLDVLSIELIDAMQDLEVRMSGKRVLPEGFVMGNRIFGSLETGRWFFGSNADAKRWEEFEKLERRYLGLRQEYQRVGQEVKVAYARVKDYQEQLKTQEALYQRRTGYFQIGLRLLIVFIVVIFCLVLGGYVFTLQTPLIENGISNQAFGGSLLILGLVGAMIAIVLARHRRSAIHILEGDIASIKETLQRLKKEAHHQKKLFYPTEETFKQVSQDYKKMKATFQGA